MARGRNPNRMYRTKYEYMTAHMGKRNQKKTPNTDRAIDDIGKIQWPDAMRMESLLKTEWINILGFRIPKDWPFLWAAATEVYIDVRNWIDSWEAAFPGGTRGFQMFKQHWKPFRHFMPLQMRLIVEQVCYDKGYPWRSLCSGFSPLRE